MSEIFTGISGSQQAGTDRKRQLGAWDDLSGLSGYERKTGQQDTGRASDFYNKLLSGDSAATSNLLAPQIQGIQNRENQRLQTMGQFGNRSGGTNAAAQATTAGAGAGVNDLISSLTGSAASGLGSMGMGLLGQAGQNAGALASMTGQDKEFEQKRSDAAWKALEQQIAGAAMAGAGGMGGMGGGGGAQLMDTMGGYDPLGLNAGGAPGGPSSDWGGGGDWMSQVF